MRTIVPSVFRLIVCGIESIGLSVYAPMLGTHFMGFASTHQSLDCLDNLTIRVTANPATIVYGQSSVISWSVSPPPNCGYTSVKLNDNAVAPSGMQTVMPFHSTIYHVTVLLNLNGVFEEKTASTRVRVEDSVTYLWCPYFLPPESLAIGQAHPPLGEQDQDLIIQWLDEPLNVLTTPLFIEPGVFMVPNRASDNKLSTGFDPDVPLLTACAFMPGTSGVVPDYHLPEPSGPTAHPPTI